MTARPVPAGRRFDAAVLRLAWPLVVVIVAAFASWPAFGDAFTATHDGLIHLLRMQQFDLGLRAGELLPRLAPDAGFGLGAPIFQIYPPLTYYLASAVHAVGFGWIDSFQILVVLSLAGSGLAMYLLARQYMDRPAAALAGALYILAPYHLIDVWTRGTLPEALAFTWLPLVLLGIERIFTGSLRYWVLLTLALVALLSTHLITAVFAAPLMLAWAASALLRRRRLEASEPEPEDGDELASLARTGAMVATLAGAGLLALAIAAAFLLPAALDQGLTRIDRTAGQVGDTGFLAIASYLPRDFWQRWDFFAIERYLDGSLNAVQLLLVAGGLVALVRRAVSLAALQIGVIAAAAMAASLLLADPLAMPAWQLAGGASMIWFPFRLMTGVALCAAVLGGLAIQQLPARGWRPLTAALAITVLAVSILWPLRPMPSGIDERFVSRQGVAAAEQVVAITSLTATGEFVPAAASPELRRSTVVASWFAEEADPVAVSLAGGQVVDATTLAWAPQARRYRIEVDAPARLALGVWYLPTWQATVGGQRTATEPAEGSGFITITLPAGVHDVALDWQPTAAAATGGIVSLLGLALVVPLALVTLLFGLVPGLLRRLAFGGGMALGGVLVLALAWFAWRDASPIPQWTGEGWWGDRGFVRIAGPAPLQRFAPGDAVPVVLEADLSGTPVPDAIVLRLVGDNQVWAERRVPLESGKLAATRHELVLPAGFWPMPFRIEAVLDPDIGDPAFAVSTPIANHTWPLRSMPLAAGGQRPAAAGTPLLAGWHVVVAGLEGAIDGRARIAAGERQVVRLELAATERRALLPGTSVRLYDVAGTEQYNQNVGAVAAAVAGQQWLEGDLVRVPLRLDVPVSLAAADYRAVLLFTDLAGPVLAPGAATILEVPLGTLQVTPAAGRPALVSTTPPAIEAAGLRGWLESIGPATLRPGQPVDLRLTWQSPAGVAGDLLARFVFWQEPLGILGVEERLIGSPEVRTSAWPAGTAVQTRYQVPVPREAPGGQTEVYLELVRDGAPLGPAALLGSVAIDRRIPAFTRPLAQEQVEADFAGLLRLVGYELDGQLRDRRGWLPGSRLDIRLIWQALTTPPLDLKVSVQLLDNAGRLIAQADADPGPPGVPTSQWVAGEYLTGQFNLTLPSDPGANLRLVVVVYDPVSGRRLSLTPGPANAIRLTDLLLAQ